MSKKDTNLTDEQILDIFMYVGVDMESVAQFPSLHEAYCDIQQYIWYQNALEGYDLPEPMTDEAFAEYEAKKEYEVLSDRIHTDTERQQALELKYPTIKA